MSKHDPDTEADAFNTQALANGALTVRHVTALTRFFQEAKGLDVDGKCGPKTREALGSVTVPTPRCWPVSALKDGRKPTVTSAFRNPQRPAHSGVDIMFQRRPQDPPMKVGDGGRTANWWIPDGTQAIAAASGIVEWSGKTATGYRCWIRHAGGMATGYFHLGNLLVGPGDRVVLGQALGTIADNPVDHDPDHLHFELARGDLSDLPRNRLDPQLLLTGALVL